MKKFVSAIVGLAVVVSATCVSAEELRSGPKNGDLIGAFYVTKVAGAPEDGVKVGKNLCYRCKNGGRPQVMVFTRSSDVKVAKLVKELDAAIPKNSSKELCCFVNVMGEDKDAAAADAKKLAKTTGAKNVPFVTPNEIENGPENYGINAEADVTIVMAEGGKVKANHVFKAGRDVKIDAVISDLAKILK